MSSLNYANSKRVIPPPLKPPKSGSNIVQQENVSMQVLDDAIKQTSIKELLNSNVSIVMCLAFNCQHNMFSTGEVGCCFKRVEIDDNGKCRDYQPKGE